MVDSSSLPSQPGDFGLGGFGAGALSRGLLRCLLVGRQHQLSFQVIESQPNRWVALVRALPAPDPQLQSGDPQPAAAD